jgi:hypothetical protein
MPVSDDDPATLVEIDTAVMVQLDSSAIGRLRLGRMNGLIRSEAVVREVVLIGEDADRIASLWRALRPAEEARCHTPQFGVRFLLDGEAMAEASLCWECNNAYGYAGTKELHFTFDASAPAAVLLLMQMRHVLGTGR